MNTTARAILAGILLAASVAGCSLQKEVYSQDLVGLPEGAAYVHGPGYSGYADRDISVTISYLAPEGVELYFSRFRGGMYRNPIAPRSYMVFSLEFDNKGEKPVTFNPRLTLFVTEKSEPVIPMDFTTMYSNLSLAGAEDVDGMMQAFRAACFDTTETIAPGQAVQKLIVYPRTDATGSGGAFLFNGLYVGHEARSIAIQYDADLALPDEE